MNGNVEINLHEIIKALIRRAWIIFLCAVICGTAVLVYTKNFISPVYQASISVYVNNNSGRENPNISSSDLAVALRLVSTYVNIIQSDRVLGKVAAEVEENISIPYLRRMISAQVIDETEMFRVTITGADPQLAARIANAIAKVAPDEIAAIIEGSSAKIIDYATAPTTPMPSGATAKAMLGAIIGAAVVILITLLQIVLNVRINGEEDLEKMSDVPILGVIPALSVDSKKGRRRKKNGGKYSG